ncbi:MAG: YidC/Oxa1 family rane protein insertase [Acidimicrobiaceae bacterium]|jgi:YidC/Oxa1 family membrane protein insertase|nr:YidC/Oxa1 family rane protein insertase [Acidimicrobiaceae bacterium]
MTFSLILAKGGLFDPIAKPLAAVLAFFYSLVPNYGIAIVLLTIAMMIVLTPLTIKQTRSMLVMQKLQPEMKKLQEQHKNDRAALNEAVMALYKEHNASPLGGCLPMLLPFPLFIALLRVLEGLSHTVKIGGKVVSEPKYLTVHTRMAKDIVAAHGQLDAFGMNLAKSARNVGGGFGHALPYFVLLLVMVGTQFYQQYQLTSRNPAAKSQPGQAAMMKFIPIFFGLISLNFPAGVVLYWTVSNIIRIGQQWALYKYDPKVKALVAQDVKEIEAKTREIDAKTKTAKPAGGGKRSSFREMFTNAAEAAADRRRGNPGGKNGAKPGSTPVGGKNAPSGRGGRPQPTKATGNALGSGGNKAKGPASAGSSGVAKRPVPQKGAPPRGAPPKGVAPKGLAPKPGAGSGTAGAAKPAGSGGSGTAGAAKPAGSGGSGRAGAAKPAGSGGGGAGAKPTSPTPSKTAPVPAKAAAGGSKPASNTGPGGLKPGGGTNGAAAKAAAGTPSNGRTKAESSGGAAGPDGADRAEAGTGAPAKGGRTGGAGARNVSSRRRRRGR